MPVVQVVTETGGANCRLLGDQHALHAELATENEDGMFYREEESKSVEVGCTSLLAEIR